jgi:hypothetical protein
MARSSTKVKPTSAWGWQTPKGKTYWETYKTRQDAFSSAEYVYGGTSFKVVRVWVYPSK